MAGQWLLLFHGTGSAILAQSVWLSPCQWQPSGRLAWPCAVMPGQKTNQRQSSMPSDTLALPVAVSCLHSLGLKCRSFPSTGVSVGLRDNAIQKCATSICHTALRSLFVPIVCPVWSWDLALMTHVSPFQLRIGSDSKREMSCHDKEQKIHGFLR